MNESKASELFRKYKDSTITSEELSLLESWYLDKAKNNDVQVNMEEMQHVLDEIRAALPDQAPVHAIRYSSSYRRIAGWAAAIVIGVSVAWLYGAFYQKRALQATADVQPGGNRAVLLLANGNSIDLSETPNGLITMEENAKIIKPDDGELTYEWHASAGEKNEDVSRGTGYNTLTTPNSGQYKVKLPDGTQVWLNAASKIKFPTHFSQQERVVEAEGEVFFDVAKTEHNGKKVPFSVKTGNQVIEVLGTQFNVNSYSDEERITTTLVEGSIQLNISGDQKNRILLKPGQQASISLPALREKNGKKVPVNIYEVDASAIAAWKDGYFSFENLRLPELMRQIARWYDIEVVYEDHKTEYEFVGRIERNKTLSQVIHILELSGVKCRLEDKTLFVR